MPASPSSPGKSLSSSSPKANQLNIVPIFYRDRDQWVSYDNSNTLKKKMDYANGKCLGGIMVKSLGPSQLSQLRLVF